MTPRAAETEVIAKVADDYRRRGHEVDVRPGGPAVPGFLGDFRPDLIARNPTEAVVVEVKVGTDTSVERLRDVAERVDRQPGWRSSLVFASAKQPTEIVEAKPAPLGVLEDRAQDAELLLETGHKDAAFLLLWSAVEGVLRLIGERAGLPVASLPSSAVVRELYSSGEISGDHATPTPSGRRTSLGGTDAIARYATARGPRVAASWVLPEFSGVRAPGRDQVRVGRSDGRRR